MKILVTGSENRLSEFKELKLQIAPVFEEYLEINEISLGGYDVVFDLNLDENPDRLCVYANLNDVLVIGSAVKKTLLGMVDETEVSLNCFLSGMNALPSFINRESHEISVLNEVSAEKMTEVYEKIGMNFLKVEDRVGMVTPRVISMIINEAYYVFQEKSATKSDVDLAMKLGTNYPHGPFEWVKLIGKRNVLDVLEALRAKNDASVYKISQMLRSEALNEKIS